MPGRIYVNNFSTTLLADITAIATTATINSATGLPVLAAGEYYYLTFDNGLGTVEIVKVTARTGTSLTIVRAQESTTARIWLAETVIDMRETADSLNPTTIISGRALTAATVAGDDLILIQDTSDSNNLKTVLASSITGGNTFETIAVSGQSNVVADSATDTLTLVAGTNVTITTNAATDTITINASGGSSTFFPFTTQSTFPTLTNTSTYLQEYTGTGGGNLTIPVASTMTAGQGFRLINNQTTGTMTVYTSGGNVLLTLPFGTEGVFFCKDTAGGTGTASWDAQARPHLLTYPIVKGASGTRIKSDGNNFITSTTTLPDNGTNRKVLIGDGTNYVESTETYAVPGAAGNLLRSDATNWVAGKAVLTTDVTGILPVANGGSGIVSSKAIVQSVYTTTGTMATGTTTMPVDNTTPQNTEGDQYMTLAITPTNSANILEIEMCGYISNGASELTTYAMFQDSTANALATGFFYSGAAGSTAGAMLFHRMVAGTTSATTFKFRAGRQTAGTITFNGYGGIAYFNGTANSYIRIKEIVV